MSAAGFSMAGSSERNDGNQSKMPALERAVESITFGTATKSFAILFNQVAATLQSQRDEVHRFRKDFEAEQEVSRQMERRMYELRDESDVKLDKAKAELREEMDGIRQQVAALREEMSDLYNVREGLTNHQYLLNDCMENIKLNRSMVDTALRFQPYLVKMGQDMENVQANVRELNTQMTVLDFNLQGYEYKQTIQDVIAAAKKEKAKGQLDLDLPALSVQPEPFPSLVPMELSALAELRSRPPEPEPEVDPEEEKSKEEKPKGKRKRKKKQAAGEDSAQEPAANGEPVDEAAAAVTGADAKAEEEDKVDADATAAPLSPEKAKEEWEPRPSQADLDVARAKREQPQEYSVLLTGLPLCEPVEKDPVAELEMAPDADPEAATPPAPLSATKVEAMILHDLRAYNIKSVRARFTKTDESLGMAVVVVDQLGDVGRLLNDWQGKHLSLSTQPMQIQVLNHHQLKFIRDIHRKLKEKAEQDRGAAKQVAMIGGLDLRTLDETEMRLILNDQIKKADVPMPLVEKITFATDPSGLSIGLAQANFKSQLDKHSLEFVRELLLVPDQTHVLVPLVPCVEKAPKIPPERRAYIQKRLMIYFQVHATVKKNAQEADNKSIIRDKLEASQTFRKRIEALENHVPAIISSADLAMASKRATELTDSKVARLTLRMQELRQAHEESAGHVEQTVHELVEPKLEELSKDMHNSMSEFVSTELTKLETLGPKMKEQTLGVLHQCGVILPTPAAPEAAEDPGCGWRLNTGTFDTWVRPKFEAVDKEITQVYKALDHVGERTGAIEEVLPTKLDMDGLKAIVDQATPAATGDKMTGEELNTGEAKSADQGPSPFAFPLRVVEARRNPFSKVFAGYHTIYQKLDFNKLDKTALEPLEEQVAKNLHEESDKLRILIREQHDSARDFGKTIKVLKTDVDVLKGQLLDSMSTDDGGRTDEAIRELKMGQKTLAKEVHKKIDVIHEATTKKFEEVRDEMVHFAVKDDVHQKFDEHGAQLQGYVLQAVTQNTEEALQRVWDEMGIKMSQEDVLRLVGERLDDLYQRLESVQVQQHGPAMGEKAPDESWTLRTGTVSEVINVGKLRYKLMKPGAHQAAGARDDRVLINNAFPMVSYTNPPPAQAALLSQTQPVAGARKVAAPSNHHQPHKVTVRGGALKALTPKPAPMRPIDGSSDVVAFSGQYGHTAQSWSDQASYQPNRSAASSGARRQAGGALDRRLPPKPKSSQATLRLDPPIPYQMAARVEDASPASRDSARSFIVGGGVSPMASPSVDGSLNLNDERVS